MQLKLLFWLKHLALCYHNNAMQQLYAAACASAYFDAALKICKIQQLYFLKCPTVGLDEFLNEQYNK